MPFKYPSMRERLLANSVSVPSPYPHLALPCRIWTGMKGGSLGYGKITIRSRYRHKYGPRKGERKVRRVYAHRVSLADHLGIPIRRLNNANHLCDRAACIEPTHLIGSTQRANVRDAVDRGRHRNGASQ